MGRGTSEADLYSGILTMNVQRHPTIPMTKRDSLASNGTRVSLLPNVTDSAGSAHLEKTDFINTNPEMVSGKKRTPKKIKRTDSYRLATNRQSAQDHLDELENAYGEFNSVANRKSGYKESQKEDRKKYNTLPRTDTIHHPVVRETRKKKHESTSSHSYAEIERVASQRSGTCPSPDTDEDQHSIQPERKKKSAFRRVKERLILTFQKDKDRNKTNKKGRQKGDKYKSPSRVKPNHHSVHDAFKTPDDVNKEMCNDLEKDLSRAKEPQGQNGSFVRGDHGAKSNHKDTVSNNSLRKSADLSPQSHKGTGLLQSIRNSFRRKSGPQKYKRDEVSTVSTPESNNNTTSSSPSLKSHGTPQSDQSLGRKSQPINIPHTDTAFQEEFVAADDTITDFFGSLIDPEGPNRNSEIPAPSYRAGTRPDPSVLRLDGLSKFRPKSFDRKTPEQSQGHRKHRGDLSPDVETDGPGFDHTDAPIHSPSSQDESDLEFSQVSDQERQRRVDHVARRLQAIGDNIVIKRESESAGSSDEGHVVGSHARRLSDFEAELLRDLRAYGDTINGTSLFGPGGNRINISEVLFPVVRAIIRAQDYSSFRSVIQREIENTVGWEQVAWYTYLIRTTMSVARTGHTVGSQVKSFATHYFTTTIRPWIQSRPNGWESVHEETEIN